MFIQLPANTIVDDRYEILELLGEGGMGCVYEAREIELNRLIALKLLQPTLTGDDEYFSRFRREGTVISRLDHPNIIKFYRFGVWKERIAYMAMELLRGASLLHILQQGSISSARCAAIGIQICEGMEHAHRQQIIHRDLKPDNIMLVDESKPELVKVIDFGLARLGSDFSGQHLTHTGELIGSVNYMSPEQCVGKAADARSDIYSLGCVLYEALTGHPPFVADNPIGLINLHVNAQAAAVTAGDTVCCTDGWNAILKKAMAKDPLQRYSTMAEMATDLRSVESNNWKNLSVTERAPDARRHSARLIVPVLLACLMLPLWVMSYWHSDQTHIPYTQNPRQTKIQSLATTHVFEDFVSHYLVHREQLPDAYRIPMLRTWLHQFGDHDSKDLALAHFWLCLELTGGASEIGHTQGNDVTFELTPVRRICGSEANEHRQKSLSLIRKILSHATLNDSESSEWLYYELVLVQIDMSRTRRAELDRLMLKRKNLVFRFVDELRTALCEIYEYAGDSTALEEMLKERVPTPEIALHRAENLARQGKAPAVKAILLSELDNLLHGRWNAFHKHQLHFLSEKFLQAGFPQKALQVCQYCEIDSNNTISDGINDAPGHVCVSQNDHLFLEAKALSELERKQESLKLIGKISLESTSTRERLMLPLVELWMNLGQPPEDLVLPRYKDLSSSDIEWQTTLACRLHKTHPIVAERLLNESLNILKNRLQQEVTTNSPSVLAIASALNQTEKHKEAQALLVQAASQPRLQDQYFEAYLALKLMLVETLIAMGDPSTARQDLSPLFDSVKARRKTLSDEYFVQALRLQARIDQLDGCFNESNSSYEQALACSRNSYDLKIEQRIALLEEYARQCNLQGKLAKQSALLDEAEKLMAASARGGLHVQVID